jgi:hypothetical protein
LNGDGKPDLAFGDYYNDTVSVFAGNGDGTFQPAMSFAVAGLPSGIAAGDFNRDGRPDLAVGAGAAVTVLTNTAR